jgi:hypothetical protein
MRIWIFCHWCSLHWFWNFFGAFFKLKKTVRNLDNIAGKVIILVNSSVVYTMIVPWGLWSIRFVFWLFNWLKRTRACLFNQLLTYINQVNVSARQKQKSRCVFALCFLRSKLTLMWFVFLWNIVLIKNKIKLDFVIWMKYF